MIPTEAVLGTKVTTNSSNGEQQFLRVEAVARVLQITPRTVYRWLHDRKIPAKKIGRAWYIPRDVVSGAAGGPTDTYVAGAAKASFLLHQGEHLLALAPEQEAVAGCMARLAEMGLQRKYRVFACCWPFTPDDFRSLLRTLGIPADAQEAEGALTICDFNSIFTSDGVEGILRKWRELVTASDHSDSPLLAIGAPSLDCWGERLETLVAFEKKLSDLWHAASSVSVCIYPLSYFVPDRLRRMGTLMSVHSGVLLWSDTKLMLLRQDEIATLL